MRRGALAQGFRKDESQGLDLHKMSQSEVSLRDAVIRNDYVLMSQLIASMKRFDPNRTFYSVYVYISNQ
jgi:hypothetical protein